MLLPLIITSPSVTFSIPPKIFNNVDFPAPDEPKIITSSPCLISKLIFLFAQTTVLPEPYFFEQFFNSIKAIFSSPMFNLF